ncbi:hypothetical protein FACUT_3042 [Fusarium acutatum]|uniref:Zn(2)-C6 fungal-type domain-containing protein n=1 Tax=Fusarium acutatum TaxID=78861 RepID=A0A8H4K1B8_9HYPO|nr:hypothetical protein FACUT_3042 [Fusarium acutatum]
MSPNMRGSTSREGPSKVERGPSEQPQYSSHNYYPPPNGSHGAITTHVPAYSISPPIEQWLNEPSRTGPFLALPSSDPSPYRTNAGATSATRLRSSIACNYCRKGKIRCSGKDSAPGGKCRNCSRMGKECIFSDIKPASAFSPPMFVPGQAQQQNHDISCSEYGANPNLTQDLCPQHSTFPPSPPPHHRGVHDDYRRISIIRRQDNSDSVTAYAARGKSVEALQDREQQARLAVPSLPVPKIIKPRSPAPYRAMPRGRGRKYSKLGKSFIEDVKAKLRKPPEVLKESIELPDPARLSIRSPTPSSSPTVSSDIDVDSISGDSEGQLDRNSRGYCVFSRVFSRLAILGQNEVTARGESSSSSKGKQVAKGGSAGSSGTKDTTSSTGGRKNPRQGDDDGDESRDRQNEPPKKKGKTSQTHCDKRSQFLACPYWKADSKKYWDCFLKKNDTIAHLKQHLTRRHTPKYYCQICYETFRDFDLFDSHALERSCTRGPSAKLEGISQQQNNQLSLKSKGSVEQQWYTVWSILFPDMEPPATIHIYSTQSEDFCRIQEFAQREGVAIMLDELESNGLVVRPDASNQLLRSTVQRAIVSIFRSYSNRREPNSEAEEPILSQAAEPDHGVSLQQELTTEGQIGHGNHTTSCTDINLMTEDGRDNSMVERLNRPSRSTWSQLPTTTSWLPRGAVQDDIEGEPWGTAFLDEPAFGESSSGNDLPLDFESSGMLDLDALLRGVISTEA